MKISTKRLNLKPLQEGDGKIIFDAIQESRACLERWLLWPRHVKTWQDSEKFAMEKTLIHQMVSIREEIDTLFFLRHPR